MQIKHLSKNPMPHRSLTDSRSTNLGLLAVSLLLVLLVSGCSTLRFPGVYRIDVGQGNILTQEMVDKLRIGMTPRQVEFVMGSPMIADTFNPDRWDYLYQLETGKGFSLRNHLVLYFENEKLAKIDTAQYKDPEALKKSLLQQLGVEQPEENPKETEASSSQAEQEQEASDNSENSAEAEETPTA